MKLRSPGGAFSITKGTYEIGDGEDATSVATRTVMGQSYEARRNRRSAPLNDKGTYDAAIDATIGGLNA